MKRSTIVLLSGILLSSLCLAKTEYSHDLEKAKKEAAKTSKLILVDFYTTWCGPCKQMDKEVFQAPEAKAIFKDFIVVKQDCEKEGTKSSQKYKVSAYPTLVVINSAGKVVLMTVGGLDQPMMKEFLAEAKKKAAKKTAPKPGSGKKSG
ncbi:MAG: thioredoxin family protein [Armatimonadota bacterium]